MNDTSERMLLDCLTCRHRFHIRQSVASMVTICPKCRHFVIPAEREIKPPVFIGVKRPPAPRTIPPPVVPVFIGANPPVRQPTVPSLDFDFLLRFIGGVVCGMVLVFGGLILLPLVLFAVAFGVITFAAFLGATFIRAAFTDKD